MVIDLSARHREILEAIGERGATQDELGRLLLTREFDDLRSEGLITYWPWQLQRPAHIAGTGTRPDAWYLTFAGADALGLELPLFRTV